MKLATQVDISIISDLNSFRFEFSFQGSIHELWHDLLAITGHLDFPKDNIVHSWLPPGLFVLRDSAVGLNK